MVWFQNVNAMQRVANIYDRVISQRGCRAIYGNIYDIRLYTGNIYGVMLYTGNIYGVMRYTGNIYDGVISERECLATCG